MTGSEASQIIDRITAMLDASQLQALIDEPIDRAAAAFPADLSQPCSHTRFHSLIGQFMRHLYDNNMACMRRLSEAEARAEAVSLLDQAYESPHAKGYHAALLDAADPSHAGMEIVLTSLTEIIKARMRQAYTRWALARCIDPADWPAQCAMAAVLLRRYSAIRPPQLLQSSPAQWAGRVPELLSLCQAPSSPAQGVAARIFQSG